MEVGTRVEIVKSDYNTTDDEDRHLRDGNRGVIVEVYQTGLLIVKIDHDPDNERDGWSFYPNQVKVVE